MAQPCGGVGGNCDWEKVSNTKRCHEHRHSFEATLNLVKRNKVFLLIFLEKVKLLNVGIQDIVFPFVILEMTLAQCWFPESVNGKVCYWGQITIVQYRGMLLQNKLDGRIERKMRSVALTSRL